MKTLSNLFAAFVNDEDGAVLVEYIVLLGILVVGVIVGITAFGGGLANIYNVWANWLNGGYVDPIPG